MLRNIHLSFTLLLLSLTIIGCEGIEKAPSEHTVKLTKPAPSDGLVFSDDNIQIRFTVLREKIDFTLWNKTQGPVAIIWDETIFRDPEGATHWVINSKEDRDTVPTKTAQATTTHPHIDPIVVPAGSSYSDYFKPFPSGFQEIPVYPFKYAEGSRMQLSLPLEINGQVKVYTFGFEVME